MSDLEKDEYILCIHTWGGEGRRERGREGEEREGGGADQIQQSHFVNHNTHQHPFVWGPAVILQKENQTFAHLVYPQNFLCGASPRTTEQMLHEPTPYTNVT